MPSRMERYAKVNKSRMDRNKSLYEQIYADKEYTNVEAVVNTPVAGNVNLEKIKEMINSHEENVKNREERYHDNVRKETSYVEYEEDKSYDIKDVLDKARGDRRDEHSGYHSLKDVEQNISNILKQKEDKKEDLENLIDTITNNSQLSKVDDKSLSLELLDDLKSNGNTMIGGSDAIRSVLKEESKEEEEMDDSFNTKGMDLEADLADLKESKASKIVTNILIVVLVVVALFVVFVIFTKLKR